MIKKGGALPMKSPQSSKIRILAAYCIAGLLMLTPALNPSSGIAQAASNAHDTLPSFSELVKQLTPVAVNISTTKTIRRDFRQFERPFAPGQPDMFRDFFGDDFFRRFFGDIPEQEYKQQSLGSGFIIAPDGFILTNNHVIEGADEIKVKTHDSKEYDAEVIGRDPKTDLALIKIKNIQDVVPSAQLGDSDALEVGEWVIAIGNPFGLQATVTAGIVSAKWRKIGHGPYEDFIQTDASINPGNSGGPLFNMNGEVVGVNTMIFSPSGGNVGIGFAIPINLAKNVVQQLKETGRVVRGWLGVVVQTVTPELAESFGLESGKGALVADVEPDGPAEKAGIRPGDIIVSFDGKDVREMSELPLIVAETAVGEKIDVEIARKGKKQVKTVVIGELKEKESEKTVEPDMTDLGISPREITPDIANAYGLTEDSGVVIVNIAPGSSADAAGLRRGDIIKEVNRRSIQSLSDYRKALKEAKNGNILMLIKRDRTSLWIVVKPQ
jgi:serine protease Do